MDGTHVYVSGGDDGSDPHSLEEFILKVISGSMTDAYNARFGHFGPNGIMADSDLPPRTPTLLDDLEAEAGPALDATWE